MSAFEGLQGLQAALAKRGIVDSKFYIRRTSETTDTTIAEDVSHLIGSFLRGEMVDHADIGDSVREAPTV
jgi:hypothetical protein